MRTKHIVIAFGCVFSLACSLPRPNACRAEDPRRGAPAVECERTDDGVWFREGERKVLFYQVRPKSLDGGHTRANYIHPLFDLRGEQVLTEDFPDDHRHHRGVFWTWHQTLADGKRMGDAWTTKRFGWRVEKVKTRTRPDGSAQLTATIHWTSPDFGSEKSFAVERLRLRVFPLQQDYRLIDFRIVIQPKVDSLQLGGSEDAKGYGGFSVRVACPPDLAFEGSEGRLEPQRTAVKSGDWLNLSATYGERKTSVAVLTDRRAPNAEQDWILRQSRSMQNARYPGPEPITVARGKPLTLHYGLVIHEDKDLKRIPAWRKRFLEQFIVREKKPSP